MSKIINGTAMIQRVKGLYESGKVDLSYYLIVKEAVQMEPALESQEPRVLTLEEAANADLVWYDWRTRGVRPAKVSRVPSKPGTYRIQLFGDIDEWVHAVEYCEYWRCWNTRPTDEQREAVEWQTHEGTIKAGDVI